MLRGDQRLVCKKAIIAFWTCFNWQILPKLYVRFHCAVAIRSFLLFQRLIQVQQHTTNYRILVQAARPRSERKKITKKCSNVKSKKKWSLMQFTFTFSSQLDFRSKREAETEKTFAKHVSSHFELCDRNTWNLICIRTRTKEMSITASCVWESETRSLFRCTSLLRRQSFRCLFLGPFLHSASAFWFCLRST